MYKYSEEDHLQDLIFSANVRISYLWGWGILPEYLPLLGQVERLSVTLQWTQNTQQTHGLWHSSWQREYLSLNQTQWLKSLFKISPPNPILIQSFLIWWRALASLSLTKQAVIIPCRKNAYSAHCFFLVFCIHQGVTLNLSIHPHVVALTLILIESMTISGSNIVVSMVVKISGLT